MIMRYSWTLLILLGSLCATSQNRYNVIDKETNQPIPFVNIWIKGSTNGTTSNEVGSFDIVLQPTDTLVLSAIGYERKQITPTDQRTITMKPSIELLGAITLEPPKFELEQLFGTLDKRRYNNGFSCGTTPWMIGSKLKYQPEFEKTPYLKTLKIATSSRVKEAQFGVRLYHAQDTLFQNPLSTTPIYGVAKRGKKITSIDLQSETIRFPTDGLVVVFEFLLIDQNKRTYTVTMKEAGLKEQKTSYEPVFYIRKEQQLSLGCVSYSSGRWFNNPESLYNVPNSELAIQLVMSN